MSKHGYTAELADDLKDVGEIIVGRMKEQIEHGHVRTGKLLESIRCDTEYDDSGATLYIYADAKSKKGVEYAEFLEHGTGPYNDTGMGNPNFHGQKPTHFISNAVDGKEGYSPSLEELIQQRVFENILNFVDAEIKMEMNTLKYKGLGG